MRGSQPWNDRRGAATLIILAKLARVRRLAVASAAPLVFAACGRLFENGDAVPLDG